MTIQIAGWFDRSSATVEAAIFATLRQSGFHVAAEPRRESYGIASWENVSLGREQLWFALHDDQTPAAKMEMSVRGPGLSLYRNFLDVFEEIVERHPACLECAMTNTHADIYPKFAAGMRLEVVVNGDVAPQVETRPSMAAYWTLMGPQIVFVRRACFERSFPGLSPEGWATRNLAPVSPHGDGVLFDCGWTAWTGGDALRDPFASRRDTPVR